MFSDLKPFWQSKGVIGGAVAVFGAIAALAGYSLAPADEAVLVEAIAAVVSGIGGLLAVWGRVTATHRIG